MFRRNLRRLRRYPSLTLLLIGMPIVFLLLFGRVRNDLDATDVHGSGDGGRAEVRATTGWGDITIRRVGRTTE
jgi:ABC-2 type transport system permease protein